jgi:zinc protease
MTLFRLIPAAFLLLTLALPARAAVDIQTVTSPGGITAWLVQEPGIPFTALEIRSGAVLRWTRPGKRVRST